MIDSYKSLNLQSLRFLNFYFLLFLFVEGKIKKIQSLLSQEARYIKFLFHSQF